VKEQFDKYSVGGGDMEMGMGMPATRPTRISLRNLRTFSSFKNSVYRIYFIGMVGQMVSINMQMIARSLLIYRLTGSPAILGAMSLANAIPMVSLSLFGGVIADRVQKKYVMFFGQVGSAIVSLGVALALTFGYLSVENAGSWWILVVSSIFQGAIMALMMPSNQAILPEIVGEEQLMNAISLGNMGMNAFRLFAPALSGFLIDAFGFEVVYYTTTGAYLLSALFIYLLPRTSKITISSSSTLVNIKEGLKYLKHETTILIILAFTLLCAILAMPFQQLMPIFTEDVLKVGASGLGIVMSVSGAGAIVSSLLIASLPNKKRGLMMLVGGIAVGLALAGFSFSNLWYLSLGLIALVGFSQTGQMALSNTLIQYYVDPTYRGRVMSIMMMQFGLMSFSSFVAGLLAEVVGVQWAVGGFAMTLVLISFLAFIFLRRVRNLD
jgi:MFS family permease